MRLVPCEWEGSEKSPAGLSQTSAPGPLSLAFLVFETLSSWASCLHPQGTVITGAHHSIEFQPCLFKI